MMPNDAVFEHLRATLGFQYEIGRVLGRGGMGTVYFARERALDREVAIKVLPTVSASDDARERFLREARTAARLTHPNIVPLYTFGDTGTVLYFVMGFVDGESLEGRLKREGRISASETQRILEELAGALVYAHEKGIVHRDIKPDNILIDHATGRAMLTDFGIAKQVAASDATLTHTGVIIGTPRYMSPEQAAGDRDIDGRSDIYSLGVVGYTMLSGRAPFEGTGVEELLTQRMTRAPVPLGTLVVDAPVALVQAVDRCLKREPAERFSEASRLLEGLRDEAGDEDLQNRLIRGGWMLPWYTANVVVMLDFAWWAAQQGNVVGARAFAALGVLGTPIGAMIDLYLMHRRGPSWKNLRRLVAQPPRRWPFWWPASWRREGDVWFRLPRPLRTTRILRTIGFGAFALAMELFVLLIVMPKAAPGASTPKFVAMASFGAFMAALAALLASAQRQFWWGKKNGMTVGESDRFAAISTTNDTFWKKPHVARFLSAAPPARPPREMPATAPDLVVAIRRVAAELPSPMRELGSESAAAARQLADAIAQFDREIAKLSRDADPAERRRLEERLESMRSAEATPEQKQMCDLYVQQLALFRRLADRLDELVARRQQVLELLRVLWLQLATLRGQLAQQEENSEVTGRIRSAIADAGRYSAGLSDVRDLSFL